MSKQAPNKFAYGMPIYGAAWPEGDIIFVCGGGGSASTGVKNRWAPTPIAAAPLPARGGLLAPHNAIRAAGCGALPPAWRVQPADSPPLTQAGVGQVREWRPQRPAGRGQLWGRRAHEVGEAGAEPRPIPPSRRPATPPPPASRPQQPAGPAAPMLSQPSRRAAGAPASSPDAPAPLPPAPAPCPCLAAWRSAPAASSCWWAWPRAASSAWSSSPRTAATRSPS
jgi:hypothetical protein